MGSDALWTGAPQWQIEGLRRLEIPEDMRKKYGSAPLGPADGPVKTAILGGNSSRLYRLQKQVELTGQDRFAALKADHVANGPGRSNLRYGYVAKPAWRSLYRTRVAAAFTGSRPIALVLFHGRSRNS
jgi:hypothetical protein